jgi:hypothetical protein
MGGRKNQCKKCRNKSRLDFEWEKNTRHKYRGSIYCVECEGFYKFGKTTTSMKKRLSTMRTGNPFEVKIVWVKRTNDMNRYERMLHQQLKDNHVRGEWYDIPQVLAKELKHIVRHDEES